ncbi:MULTISPECIES: hypothetical protein [Burkholderia cepacia complex]|uniref:Uncharacterized protein n=1 Tax=Burkholderia cenocepacia TaxID=95486 RepID=A0A6B2MMH0_9BURK|nr:MULTISPECIES: hypothetical protein [Burkholderia cepacia complex]KWO10345.1 hypothetical protein WM26_18505 [Burkholderia cepacia]NDV76730.1 hypothetical protein [Burkholderia cenocepacia]RQU31308.1 hypothetical protein DF142_33780 [Burkholderia cenocepacia]RQU61702.1 hypothetical protein DF140_25220 [Burkholderia cenocepacia]
MKLEIYHFVEMEEVRAVAMDKGLRGDESGVVWLLCGEAADASKMATCQSDDSQLTRDKAFVNIQR